MPFLLSLIIFFPTVESWTLTLSKKSEVCSSLNVVLGSFVNSWSCPELSMRSWSNFSGPATPSKVQHWSKFSPFVDNGSHSGSLESQSIFGYFFFKPINKWNHHVKTGFCIYSDYLCLIVKFVWWSKTCKCDKYTNKPRNEERGIYLFTVLFVSNIYNLATQNLSVLFLNVTTQTFATLRFSLRHLSWQDRRRYGGV